MKKIFQSLSLISLFAVVLASCKLDKSDDPTKDPDKDPTEEFYITFKADGVTVTETEVTATRGATASPRTLTITGTAKDGAAPKFKYYTEETIAGFEEGLTIHNTSSTYPSDYVEYTNSASALYSTKTESDGIYFSFFDISYTNGGVVSGIFSGSVKTVDGKVVAITDGKYNVKCSN